MTNGESTLREEPALYEVNDDNFWDNLQINDDEEEAPAPPQEATQPPPPQPRNKWITLDNL